MAWITIDPESGYEHDDFAGTHIYEDCGQTLAEQFPEQHFACPNWAARIFDFTRWIHGFSCRLVSRLGQYHDGVLTRGEGTADGL